jgi:hypothetical protein
MSNSKPIDRALLHRFTTAWIDSYRWGSCRTKRTGSKDSYRGTSPDRVLRLAGITFGTDRATYLSYERAGREALRERFPKQPSTRSLDR